MKKIIAIVALALGFATAAHAQFGIIGGFTSSATTINTKDAMANFKNVSLYHVGVAYRFEIGPFFAVQPQLVYQMKGANLHQTIVDGTYQNAFNSFQSKTGYLELGANLQLGFDLLVARPFVLFEPFVGYAVFKGEEVYSKVGEGILNGSVTDAELNAALNTVKNGFEWGFGVGGGVELFGHVQLSVQWFMNLGNLYNQGKFDGNAKLETVKNSYADIKNYQGIKVTLGVFF